jgi:hypothetical protein
MLKVFMQKKTKQPIFPGKVILHAQVMGSYHRQHEYGSSISYEL